MTQMEKIQEANKLLSSIWDEFLHGSVDESILQTAVYCQVDINRIVYELNERRNYRSLHSYEAAEKPRLTLRPSDEASKFNRMVEIAEVENGL